MRIVERSINTFFFNLFTFYPETVERAMRLFVVSLISVLVFAVIILSLRLFGLSQDHLQRRHHFLDSQVLFSIVGDEKLPNYPSIANMQESKARVPNLGWLLPIYVDNDKLVVRVEEKSIDLEDILKQFSSDYFFFQLMENKENINFLLNESIKKYALENRVLLFSPFRNVVIQFRNLRPQWLTALSTPEANLFFLSHKIFLETISPFAADFLWLSTEDRQWIKQLSTAEIERRHKFMICSDEFKQLSCKAYATKSPTTYSAAQTSR